MYSTQIDIEDIKDGPNFQVIDPASIYVEPSKPTLSNELITFDAHGRTIFTKRTGVLTLGYEENYASMLRPQKPDMSGLKNLLRHT